MGQSPGCLDEDRGAMLLAALPVRRAAFRGLLSGRPVSIEEVASAAGMSSEAASRAGRNVASVGMAEMTDRAFVGMDGITTRPTRHRIRLEGVDLWTWCAYDIVGIAAALGVDAIGTTPCGMCGRTIDVDIREGEPIEMGVVGWMPTDACSNVMEEFCPSALFFCSPEHLDVWRLESEVGVGEALGLRALAERGREEWRQLVA